MPKHVIITVFNLGSLIFKLKYMIYLGTPFDFRKDMGEGDEKSYKRFVLVWLSLDSNFCVIFFFFDRQKRNLLKTPNKRAWKRYTNCIQRCQKTSNFSCFHATCRLWGGKLNGIITQNAHPCKHKILLVLSYSWMRVPLEVFSILRCF